jgi:hypothetical protein
MGDLPQFLLRAIEPSVAMPTKAEGLATQLLQESIVQSRFDTTYSIKKLNNRKESRRRQHSLYMGIKTPFSNVGHFGDWLPPVQRRKAKKSGVFARNPERKQPGVIADPALFQRLLTRVRLHNDIMSHQREELKQLRQGVMHAFTGGQSEELRDVIEDLTTRTRQTHANKASDSGGRGGGHQSPPLPALNSPVSASDATRSPGGIDVSLKGFPDADSTSAWFPVPEDASHLNSSDLEVQKINTRTGLMSLLDHAKHGKGG